MDKVPPHTNMLFSKISSATALIDEISHRSLENAYDLVVFSHLRWEFVFQRPQHIISRMSRSHKVLFVEEPIAYAAEEEGTANFYQAAKNIYILQPKISWEKMVDNLTPLVKQYVQELNMTNPILWFYSAMFSPIIDRLKHNLVIYDCMDELSAFKGAPKDLLKKEQQLLNSADLVFTGGKSLYESKRKAHSDVYCFPSSVEENHFRKALLPLTKVPDDLAKIPRPCVGFYGVVDERMDLALIEKVAKKLQTVSFVIVGPVVKIDMNSLPKLPNLYYLGQKSYEELPHYLKGFDVAMMPFALNEATRFISPTKTLEFMAAEKPIVSTPIYDVKRDYQQVVKIAENSDDFCVAIEQYLQETPNERKERVAKEQAVVARTSWNSTVSQMRSLIVEKLRKQKAFAKVTEQNMGVSPTSSLAVNLNMR